MIDFDKKLMAPDGKTPLRDPDYGEVTLRIAAFQALQIPYPDEANLAGDEKFKRYKLIMDIENGNTELKAEDVSLLKKLIGKAYGPMVVGRAWEALDPAEAK